MPNWKSLDDYMFNYDSTEEWRCKFCWEFMRRNTNYREDYQVAQHDDGPVYSPPKESNESDSHWMCRIMDNGKDPRKIAPIIFYAIKWAMRPPMQDPLIDNPPVFTSAYPILINRWEDLEQYFHEVDETIVVQKSGFATIVFNLENSIKDQLEYANLVLNDYYKEELNNKNIEVPKKPKSFKEKKWVTYLRLIDAKAAQADTNDIVKYIEEYTNLPKIHDGKSIAADRVSDHYKIARELMNNPLSILR